MKLLSASILASAAATVMGQQGATQLSPTGLETRWDMEKPNITYVSAENKFVLDFLTASPDNYLNGLQEEFYDINCKDDGSGFPENVIEDVFYNPDPAIPGRPRMTLNGVGGRPQLEFTVDTQAAAANSLIYEIVGEKDSCPLGQVYAITAEVDTQVDMDDWPSDVIIQVMEAGSGNVVFTHTGGTSQSVNNIEIPGLCRGQDYVFNYTDTYGDGLTDPYNTEGVTGSYNSSGTPDIIFQMAADDIDGGFLALFNLPLNPQNPATNIQGREGQGMLRFCVRSSLGYDGTLTQNETLKWQIEQQNYQEVNFIESLITIFFDLTAGFDVLEFNVDPKERVETTAQKEQYDLEAWLCELTSMETTTFPNPLVIPKVVPQRIDQTYLETEDEANQSFFNQGALITVCVAPDDAAWQDGIRMNGINTFNWLRSDLAQTAGQLSTGTANIEQQAIYLDTITGNGAPSQNGLTSYIPADCLGGPHYCTFSSILFADFYVARGVASGSGTANLIFGAPGSRRLGAPEEEATDRKLQEDEVAESPFDVSVPVDLTDTGPAGLKTAGGASYGITALASALALLGAALLA